MNLRIAHVTATFPPYRGGTGNVCYHNARELARRGHQVAVFTAAVPGAPASELLDGITVRRLRPLVRAGNAPLLPGLLPALRGFDLVHLHYPFILGAEIARCAAAMYRMPIVLSFHNDLIGNGSRARVFAAYQRLSSYLTVRTVNVLCAVSIDHFQSSRLCAALGSRIPRVVELSNGVDTATFTPAQPSPELRQRYGIPEHAQLILFVAALDRAHHFKGLETLLQALRQLPANVHLLVVGDGDMRAAYEQQAADLGVAERVIFAGAIDQVDTPPFYCAADVTALPSSPPESFGLVLIESLACGTPVIASNIPGVRTVVNHGVDGLLVAPGDPVALAESLQALLSDDRRHQMGVRGRAKVEQRYDWRSLGEQLETIYHDVLREHRQLRRVAEGV